MNKGSLGGLMFGRVTYELMANHWPNASGEVADFMNALPKFVFSRTLTKSNWNNTRMFNADLIPHRLIEEFRIAVNPIILGGGTPLFKQGERVKLKLLDTRTLSTGVVILRYAPAT